MNAEAEPEMNIEATSEKWTNWEESIVLNPAVVVYPETLEEISAVIRNEAEYPSPVRAAGSRHSTTHCAVADQGTLMIMRRMNRIISIDEQNLTVTVQAGALYIDVAKALQEKGLQFYVNVEIGNLTMGSAASTGTKDASMPGEFGQVCSYCCSVAMVLPSGELSTVDDDQPELMQAVRSSYGLLGVIHEVTFRVQKIRPMHVEHRSYSVHEFAQALPALKAQNLSLMYYLFPFQDRITVELRHYTNEVVSHPNRWLWWIRNYAWKTFVPTVSYLSTQYIGWHGLRYAVIDGLSTVLRAVMVYLLRSKTALATDQIIRYPEKKGVSKYTFSIWAFPEENIMETLVKYFRFCQDYYQDNGFRCDMLNVGYRISEDKNPLFSYSWSGSVMTLDPVATGAEGWDEFLKAYNEFCVENNGVPLFNQSKWLTPTQVRQVFGERVDKFWSIRSKIDPNNRLLNQYFKNLFAPTTV